MKNDIFYMTLNILNVWKQDEPAEYFACTIVNSVGEDYTTFVFNHDSDIYQIIFDLFSDEFETKDSVIYMTKFPCEQVIKACIAKNISKIIHIGQAPDEFRQVDKIEIVKFTNTFGRIIDLLSQYKPQSTSINMI